MMLDEITQENELEINSNNQNQEPKEVEKMPLNNIQKAKELKNNANLIVRRTNELDIRLSISVKACKESLKDALSTWITRLKRLVTILKN